MDTRQRTPAATHRRGAERDDTASTVRRSRKRLLVAAGAVAILVLAGAIVWHVHTSTPSVPYSDPAVTGRLTLCSADGAPLEKGSVTDQPFAVQIVGGTAATGPYAARGGTATLIAAQPRAGVDAAEWSTLQLTAAQEIADPAQPTIRPDAHSTTLAQFLTAYPASDHGWVQLRLVLGGIDVPAQTQSYAAVDLHVSGGTWTVADPGSASCTPARS